MGSNLHGHFLKIVQRDMLRVLGTVEGRRILGWIISISEAEKEPFDPDPLKMSYKLGKASIGRGLINMIGNTSESDILSMLREYREDYYSKEAKKLNDEEIDKKRDSVQDAWGEDYGH